MSDKALDGREDQRHLTADRHLRTLRRRAACIRGSDRESTQFYPPHRYRASLAGTSSLLWVHLRPRTHRLLLSLLLVGLTPEGGVRLSPDIALGSCELPHPQTRSKSVHKPGVPLFCALTHLARRIRFAYAMCRSLSIASFSWPRWPDPPCDSNSLPRGQGGVRFLPRRLSELELPVLLGILSSQGPHGPQLSHHRT